MPRGYLKHKEEFCGRKRARGGSSRNKCGRISKTESSTNISTSKSNKKPVVPLQEKKKLDNEEGRKNIRYKCYRSKYDYYNLKHEIINFKAHELDDYNTILFSKLGGAKDNFVVKLGKCAICLDEKPVQKLMNNCNHSSACSECLREAYVIHAQKDVMSYPLRCFYPGCNRLVSSALLEKHNLFRSVDELTKHFRLSVLARSYRGNGQVAHCPNCDHPKQSYPYNSHGKEHSCRLCKTKFYVNNGESSERVTILALESITYDRMGGNDGWCRCPKCKMIISKGDGCDHIACPCGQHFYFSEWRERSSPRNELPAIVNVQNVQESIRNI